MIIPEPDGHARYRNFVDYEKQLMQKREFNQIKDELLGFLREVKADWDSVHPSYGTHHSVMILPKLIILGEFSFFTILIISGKFQRYRKVTRMET